MHLTVRSLAIHGQGLVENMIMELATGDLTKLVIGKFAGRIDKRPTGIERVTSLQVFRIRVNLILLPLQTE